VAATEVWYLGVRTAGSLIHRAIGLWRELLPAPCEVHGVDLEPGSPGARYVELLEELRAAPARVAGAVVSVHKVGLFDAGHRLFAELDPIARACEEVNAVRRAGSDLHGYARDPISVGRVVDRIWPRGEGEVVCIGAGGTARALIHHLLAIRAEPVRVVCADHSEAALGEAARLAPRPIVTRPGNGPWDELIAAAPPGSLIVNATGLGKDRPGSPIGEGARFPEGAVVWELNYRGELHFLDRARAQAAEAGLEVHDGWRLFCHGWAAALSAVLELDDDPELGERFAAAAASIRPG
jgi:shikimate dehydrogenase